ncbi:hypothetical protein NKG05_02070 [Oerskovia sp. M15]
MRTTARGRPVLPDENPAHARAEADGSGSDVVGPGGRGRVAERSERIRGAAARERDLDEARGATVRRTSARWARDHVWSQTRSGAREVDREEGREEVDRVGQRDRDDVAHDRPGRPQEPCARRDVRGERSVGAGAFR